MVLLTLLISWILASGWQCNGQLLYDDFHEAGLVSSLMDGYSREARPVKDHADRLTVQLSLTLVEIIDIDEVDQILTTSVWMTQRWNDFGLVWNPEDHYNITSIVVPITQLWRPDIVLYNNVNDNLEGGVRMTSSTVRFDGSVTWNTQAILKSACEMNPLHFPYDTQNCSLKFGSWSYHGFQIDVIVNETEADTSVYQTGSGEWDLTAMPTRREVTYYPCCLEPYPVVYYYMILKRFPLFYNYNLIMPCIIISSLILLGFFLPSDACERVTLTITVLLSLTVFQLLAAETLPPTSDVVPYLSIYFILIIIMSGICSILCVVTLTLHNRGSSTEVPQWLRVAALRCSKIVFMDFPTVRKAAERYQRVESERDAAIHGVSNKGFQNDEGVVITSSFACGSDDKAKTIEMQEKPADTAIDHYIGRIALNLEFLTKCGRDTDAKDETSREWKEIAMGVDRGLIIVFLIISLLITLVTLLLAKIN